MASRPRIIGRRPHRTKEGKAPAWLVLQRQAIAGYQRRHPGLDYNQVRSRQDFKDAYRTVRRETSRPAGKRDAGALAGARRVLGLRRAHRVSKREADWLTEYRYAINAYAHKHGLTKQKTYRDQDGHLRTRTVADYTRVRSVAEFRTAWADLRREQRKPLDQQDRSPDGVMARSLETLGLRVHDDPWDVGDTPTGKVTKVG